jgi:hypothetical protein
MSSARLNAWSDTSRPVNSGVRRNNFTWSVSNVRYEDSFAHSGLCSSSAFRLLG